MFQIDNEPARALQQLIHMQLHIDTKDAKQNKQYKLQLFWGTLYFQYISIMFLRFPGKNHVTLH